jgi:hypothetical protein
MIEDLRTVKALLRKHGSSNDSAWLGHLITVAEADPAEFWRQFNCNEIWGGAGSIADQFLVQGLGDSMERRKDRKNFYRAMARLADEMAAAGIANDRAQRWAQAFTEWSNNEL